jgi:hypothetical protein
MISRIRRPAAIVAALALAASVAIGCGDDKPKSAAKVETTKGRVRAPVPEAAGKRDKTADPDAGKRVPFVKRPAQLPAAARRQASVLDVRPAAERRAATSAPEGGIPEPGDADYDRFLTAVIPLIDGFWRTKTARVSRGAQYTEPGDLVSYDGANGPGCFGQKSDDMVGNAYYCPSVLAANSCKVAASNQRYCLGGDIIAWDRSGLMLPFYRKIGDLATALVLAHEWGHLIQARVYPEFAYRTTIRNELQADCYAGAWALEMKRQGRVDIGSFNQTLYLFESTGGSGDAWLDPDSHGNKFQRIRSFTQGFERDARGCIAPRFDSMLHRIGLEKET